jgi:hypothetical protein
MTSGSRLEIISAPRSVGVFHSVWAYSGVFWALSLHSPGPPGGEVNDSRVGSWRDCFGMSFAWRRHLLTRGSEVDGLAYPLHQPTAHSRPLRGHGLPLRCHLVLLQ